MTKTLLVLGSTILAVALAGCGSANGSSSGASPTADRQDLGVKFARCMRQHGVPMEDPKPGGGVTLKLDKATEDKVDAAQKACAEFSPMQAGDPQQRAEDLERLTRMTQCLRRNGIPVEDPKPGKAFSIKGLRGNEAKTQAAMKICQKEAGMPDPEGGSSGPAGGGSVSKAKG